MVRLVLRQVVCLIGKKDGHSIAVAILKRIMVLSLSARRDRRSTLAKPCPEQVSCSPSAGHDLALIKLLFHLLIEKRAKVGDALRGGISWR
ncbi:hypothetical protein, partial [Yoonia sp.]|uniref:hypothetical protein n=1 Tax=Yoonia sp. TaxID=2212373 RepID=UPI0025E8BAD1